MDAKGAIRTALDSTQKILEMFVGDLSDADLLVRPVPGANTIAWQLGHLIASEARLAGNVPGARPAELPAGFAEKHTPQTATAEPPAGFPTKAEYLSQMRKVREATLAALAQVSDADLDKPISGPVAAIAPTVGALFVLIGNHTMMHAGQFSVVRRKLGKPVLF